MGEFGKYASSFVTSTTQQSLSWKSINPQSEAIWTGVCQFMWEHSTEGNKMAVNKKKVIKVGTIFSSSHQIHF